MSRKLFEELGVRWRDWLPLQPLQPLPPVTVRGRSVWHVLLPLESFPPIPGKGKSITWDLGLLLQTGWGGESHSNKG